ncbi:MAG: type II toxin-antitoxin system Phd/YefM family antitoxin [Verrucomicrobia bacterium]|nr:type II toxin-antitoxin system Phd/YefM family antitoxin [Verrucomicrobiota bacterium]
MGKRRPKTPTKKVHRLRPRRVWQLQQAKARFSQLVKEVEEDGYHLITKNGHPVAMVISTKEFEKLTKPKNTLLEFFRAAPLPDIDIDIERDKDTGRDVDL